MITNVIFLVFIALFQLVHSREYLLRVKSNAPAIKGSVVTFTADLLELNGTLANVGESTLKWEWIIDDHERQEFKTAVPHAEWTHQFPKISNKNLNNTYKVEVNVGSWYLFIWYPMAKTTMDVEVTSMLNGDLKLSQLGTSIKSQNISTGTIVDLELDVRHGDLESVSNASQTIVHWFIDCRYIRQSKELKTQEIFSKPNQTHHIEALIESSFDPATTKLPPTLSSKLISKWQTQHKADLPYVCHNKSQIAADPDKVYGHFQSNITVFDAISDVIVNGTAWINDGDDYELNIYCSGSPNFEYCHRQIDGPFILEGDETCDEWITLRECQQNLKLTQSVLNVKSFTVLVIIRNAVSIERKIFVVNIKQPIVMVAAVVGTVVFTLCVIAVVACCLVRCIRKKKSVKRKSVRSDAEATLIGQNPVKVSDSKRMSNKFHN